MRWLFLFFDFVLFFNNARSNEIFDSNYLFDADTCYSLSMVDNERIQSFPLYTNDRDRTINQIPDSIVKKIEMADTICVFENFLYGINRYYDIDFLVKDTIINICWNYYNDEIEVSYEKLLPWNVNDKTHFNIGERVLGNLKHTIDTDMSMFYKWVEESKEKGHGDTFSLCTLFIKEKERYRLERYPIWRSWLFYKMHRDFYDRWSHTKKRKE